ncbi:helix-turn-helix domain-containing protein [Flagellimonas pacifica]|uniref:Helix-turn-helix n=1 Tax=Flagellimonas pacifica TaxID=1247520 RepID=A0A285MIP3_9FLAO|nr:helix-turn-helix transcriptional regulator [Allomuricauda parva]SNY95371.1 Helix-turn-helix [Allomuricauda parva]
MKQPKLGLKISELRKQKGFTQEELVELCNINVRTLQRIESGEVTPRSYTVKTILSALDYDLENLNDNESELGASGIGFIAPKEAKSIHFLLTLAWISGLFFLITAIFEGIADYVRIEDDEFIYGQWGHLTVKILVLVFNLLFLYGFLITGKLLKNYLMKIAAVLMMAALIAFYGYDIVSIFNDPLEIEAVFLAEAIIFGVLGMLFGISILKSGKKLRTQAFAAGGAELLMSFCLLTVFLTPLALFLFFPTVILEMVLIFKIAALVKEKK